MKVERQMGDDRAWCVTRRNSGVCHAYDDADDPQRRSRQITLNTSAQSVREICYLRHCAQLLLDGQKYTSFIHGHVHKVITNQLRFSSKTSNQIKASSSQKNIYMLCFANYLQDVQQNVFADFMNLVFKKILLSLLQSHFGVYKSIVSVFP